MLIKSILRGILVFFLHLTGVLEDKGQISQFLTTKKSQFIQNDCMTIQSKQLLFLFHHIVSFRFSLKYLLREAVDGDISRMMQLKQRLELLNDQYYLIEKHP